MARYDDLNTGTLGYLTFMSVILLIITVLLLQALCYNWIDWQEDVKQTKQSYNTADDFLKSQKDSLNEFKKVQVTVPVEIPAADAGTAPKVEMQTQERIHIPIGEAEAILLKKLKSKAAPAPST
ncbi:MAG: hypothetical protein IT423_08410 [Pirellulaceae bacterium]|nr:hypothetical protein [Pirellulaceae bacterium]